MRNSTSGDAESIRQLPVSEPESLATPSNALANVHDGKVDIVSTESQARSENMSQVRRVIGDSMGGANIRKPYPTGPNREMNDDWKKLVKDTLDATGRTEEWLEKALGRSKGSLNKMFKAHTSKLVDPICKLLDIKQPSDIGREEQTDYNRRVTEALDKFSDEKRKFFLEIIENEAALAKTK